MGFNEVIYLIGSLRNPQVMKVSARLRAEGFEVFDEWYAAGPEADDYWRDYEIGKGWSYEQSIRHSLAADHVFQFDKKHLDRATSVVLVLPAGKSGHLELGYAIGKGKGGYILLDSPDRWDVMYKFADHVTTDIDEIIAELKETEHAVHQERGPGTRLSFFIKSRLKRWGLKLSAYLSNL